MTRRDILRVVAKMHDFTPDDLKGRNKSRPVAHARQAAMVAMRRAGFTLGQIGQTLGRHHTTVIAGIRAHEKRESGNG